MFGLPSLAKHMPLPVNGDEECVVAEEVIVMKKTKDGEIPMRFEKCSPRCKPLTRDEVDSIPLSRSLTIQLMRLYGPCVTVIRVAQICINAMCLDQRVVHNK